MADVNPVWERIAGHVGEMFQTVTGLEFTYEVPNNFLRVSRTIRNLARSNFAKALERMPAGGPAELKDRQGASHTWAILLDPRIRAGDW